MTYTFHCTALEQVTIPVDIKHCHQSVE